MKSIRHNTLLVEDREALLPMCKRRGRIIQNAPKTRGSLIEVAPVSPAVTTAEPVLVFLATAFPAFHLRHRTAALAQLGVVIDPALNIPALVPRQVLGATVGVLTEREHKESSD